MLLSGGGGGSSSAQTDKKDKPPVAASRILEAIWKDLHAAGERCATCAARLRRIATDALSWGLREIATVGAIYSACCVDLSVAVEALCADLAMAIDGARRVEIEQLISSEEIARREEIEQMVASEEDVVAPAPVRDSRKPPATASAANELVNELVNELAASDEVEEAGEVEEAEAPLSHKETREWLPNHLAGTGEVMVVEGEALEAGGGRGNEQVRHMHT